MGTTTPTATTAAKASAATALLALTSSLLLQTQTTLAQRIIAQSENRHRRRQLHKDEESSAQDEEEEQAEEDDTRTLLQETPQQTDDLVIDLPGLDPSVKITHHAGRIGLRSGKRNNIFYWHFPASKSPETAPLVIWLNGGPGCSSMQGLFLGISPFTLINATNIEINEHSWHHSVNMLFIDQPVGTGMSFTRGNEYRTDEGAVAADFYDFLVKFLLSHMEYLSIDERDNKQITREIFLFGESHAGRYIPQFSSYILKQNKASYKDTDMTIRLKGAGIGNGWVHPPVQYEYSDYAHGLGLLTFGQVRSLKNKYADCENALIAGKFNTPACFDNMNSILRGLKSTGGMSLNFYDVREYRKSVSSYPSGQNDMVAYLNQPSVRKALHANEESSFKFSVCSDPVYSGLQDFDGVSSLSNVQEMLREGIKVMFYNGQWDMMCNHFGTEKLLLHLDWDGSAEYQEATKYTWATDGRKDPAGFAQQGGNLTYLVIANGGHMVPMDVPDVAVDMMRKFVSGVAFTNTAQLVANTKTNMTDLESFQCYVADSTSSSSASTLQLGVTWLWVAVVISVVSSVLAVSVTLMCIRNKKNAVKRTGGGHSMIVQESDDDDSGDEVDDDREEEEKLEKNKSSKGRRSVKEQQDATTTREEDEEADAEMVSRV